MPTESQHNAIHRQWEMLKLLPSREPGMTTLEIRQSLSDLGYDVDNRTIQRNLEKLQSLFPINHGDENPYRWYWESKHAFETLGITVTDALTLHLLKRVLKPILPVATTRQLEPLFEMAESKLAALADSNEIAHWASLIAVEGSGLPVIPPEINSTILETVQNALLNGESLKIHYAKAGADTARESTINPIGLVQSGEKTYLVAANPKYPEPATYALHRIDKAERTYEKAKRPNGMSLQRFLDEGKIQFFNEGAIDLKAWVSKRLGDQLAETKLSETQQLSAVEDGYELSVTLPNSLRLRQWVLSWAGHLEVLEPTALREDIAKQLREGAARYA